MSIISESFQLIWVEFSMLFRPVGLLNLILSPLISDFFEKKKKKEKESKKANKQQ